MRDYLMDEPMGPTGWDMEEDATELTMECKPCQRERFVVEVHDAPGFAAGHVTTYDLDCGHQVVEAWGDDLDAVR